VTVRDWIGLAGGLILLAVTVALIVDVERLHKAHRGNVEAWSDLVSEITRIDGDYNRLWAWLNDTADADLDRPTPAQQAAPTRPDLEAQHPSPQAGRHRADTARERQ